MPLRVERAALRLLDGEPEFFLAQPVAVVQGPGTARAGEFTRPGFEAMHPGPLRLLEPAGSFADVHFAPPSWSDGPLGRGSGGGLVAERGVSFVVDLLVDLLG